MVRHADIEGECQDVGERLEVLDAGEMPDEGVPYENCEKFTHLYLRSGMGDGDVQCICDALGESTIREDAESENDQQCAPREGVEACGDAEITDSYASRDDADTCAESKSCEVGAERSAPTRPECVVTRSGR